MAEERVAARWWIATASLLAALLIVGGGAVLVRDAGDAVIRIETEADGIPVTVLRPAGGPTAPGLLVAHGFAGSAALMDPLATAWARAGFAVAVPDLPGHGRNPEPLRTGGTAAAEAQLPAAVDRVAQWLQRQPFVEQGRIALVGHSMGAGAVVRAAAADAGSGQPRYSATVAISLPSAQEVPDGEPAAPRNLLLLWGAAEPARFEEAALAALRAGHPGAPPGQLQGDAAEGTARMAVEVAGAEHLSILWRGRTAQLTYDWLAPGSGLPAAQTSLAPRMLGVAAVAAGGVLGLVGLSAALLGNRRPARAAAIGAGRAVGLMVVAAAAASAAAAAAEPLAAALPLAVGGHLAVWFAAGAVVLLIAAAASGRRPAPPTARCVGAGLLLAAWVTVCLAVPARFGWAAVAPVGPRIWLIALFAAVFGAWFLADGLLVRRPSRGATALLLLVSRAVVVSFLLLGVALLGAPGFLTLLLPLMVPLLALLASAAWIVAGRTGSALVAALVQAVPLAVLVGTTFPLLSAA